MLFSSLVFLYIFLPLTLLGYFLAPKALKNSFLFLASLVFFAWGGVSYSVLFIFSIIFNYIFGLLIDAKKHKKNWLIIGVLLNLSMLVIFKYANFIIENLNDLLSLFQIPLINNPSILLPVGISFYTFHALSYLVDVYRKTCSAQRNFMTLGLYISFFPQLIAGPIIRYHDIQDQLYYRVHSISKFSAGIQRFILGFAKKVLIANTLAFVADEIFSMQPETLNTGLAWIGILAYSLQIYYDFAGYSDMAIGLARMFGFELLENFNFPYIAKSIQEFWRRWHISLSNWFRDYLYIPLGGNRMGANRTLLNLFIVFFVTGFWHGASWSFVIWGLVHGLFLALERTSFGNFIKRLPTMVQSCYTIFIAIMAWVLFRSETLNYALNYYKVMFGQGDAQLDQFLFSKIVTLETVLVFIIAILGAFGFFQKMHDFLNVTILSTFKCSEQSWSLAKGTFFLLFMFFVLLYGTGNLVLGAYNPFIYFRF